MVQEASPLALFLGAAKHWNVLNCWESSRTSCQGFAGSSPPPPPHPHPTPPPSVPAPIPVSLTDSSLWSLSKIVFSTDLPFPAWIPDLNSFCWTALWKERRHQDISDPYWWTAWNTTTQLTLHSHSSSHSCSCTVLRHTFRCCRSAQAAYSQEW